jgi:crossover junction endodeoxyribonuclease RuvC
MISESTKISTDFDRIILGIDPGTQVMGYGIIGIEGKRTGLIGAGVLILNKYSEHELRLAKIFERTIQLIETYQPDEMALEAPFFGKNVQSMLKLGRAQGVAMAAGLSRQIPIAEYSPKKVKQSITGNGNASKEQVAAMLENLLSFKNDSKYLDATDGLAVAMCHYFQSSSKLNVSGKGGWKAFLRENPDRVK